MVDDHILVRLCAMKYKQNKAEQKRVSREKNNPASTFGPSTFSKTSDLEAVELCFVADIGELIHVFEEPVVCFSRGQHSHPAKLVCHSLLKEGDGTRSCHSGFKVTRLDVAKSSVLQIDFD